MKKRIGLIAPETFKTSLEALQEFSLLLESNIHTLTRIAPDNLLLGDLKKQKDFIDDIILGFRECHIVEEDLVRDLVDAIYIMDDDDSAMDLFDIKRVSLIEDEKIGYH